jgi:hypothetical protein
MSIEMRIDGEEKSCRKSCPNATSATYLTWAALRTNSSVCDEKAETNHRSCDTTVNMC